MQGPMAMNLCASILLGAGQACAHPGSPLAMPQTAGIEYINITKLVMLVSSVKVD